MPYVVTKRNGRSVNEPIVYTEEELDNIRRAGVPEKLEFTNVVTRRKTSIMPRGGGKKLTYKERKRLPAKEFAIPSARAYPIENEAHARNALARVSAYGTPREIAAVRAAVHRKYPEIGKQTPAVRRRRKPF